MKKVVLCQHYFNIVGGIETFIINFCKTFYKDYDITLLCRTIDKKQALSLSKYVTVICEPLETIECDICIITSVLVDKDNLKYVKYKKMYQMVHSDWSEMKKFWDWKFESYDPNAKLISVSEAAKKSALKEFGKESILIPNLLFKENISDKKPLRLVAFTRLTEEKGYERMKQLCDLYEKYNIPYIFDVYGTNPLGFEDYKHMYLHKSITNIDEKVLLIKNSNYVVQLSDTESFCYNMYEGLMYGVPVLVTPFPNAVTEIKDGENGYILPFDMNLTKKQVLDIYNKIPQNAKYEQTGVKEAWIKVLR